MKSLGSAGSKRLLFAAAACGMLAFFAAPSFGQHDAARKPVLDGPLSPLLLAVDASKLTGDARRTFDVLALIIGDADKAATKDERNGYLEEFLAKSRAFVSAQPDSLQVWTLRAVAALEVNQAAAGQEACQRMVELKAGDLDDPAIRRVLALLDRKGWFMANAAGDTAVSVQGAKPAPEQTGTGPVISKGAKPATNTIAIVASDVKWGGFDAYVRKMMEAIQNEWDRTLADSSVTPPPGSHVTVRFTMDWKGYVAEVLGVESTSSDQGKQCCITAINMASPYGEWTDKMIATLGASQQLTLRFNYETKPAKNAAGATP